MADHRGLERDEGRADETVEIDRFLSAWLIMLTRTVSKLTQRFVGEAEETALAAATVLLAGAALEALATEAAYLLKPDLYKDKSFLKSAGATEKLRRLLGHVPEEAQLIWDLRVAMSHTEPDSARTRRVGPDLNAASAAHTAGALERVSRDVWGARMPPWFSETLGVRLEE